MARKEAVVPEAGNGTKAIPNAAGTIRQPLDKPEPVANLAYAEVSEIKERRRLIEKVATDIVDQQKVLGLLRNEQTKYLQGLLEQRGLPMQDDYNVDSEAGVIMRIARYVEPDSVVLTETEPIAVSDEEAGK
jgi:hypothetical protein